MPQILVVAETGEDNDVVYRERLSLSDFDSAFFGAQFGGASAGRCTMPTCSSAGNLGGRKPHLEARRFARPKPGHRARRLGNLHPVLIVP